MNDFFTKELLYRLGSVIVFVPLVILPLIYNNYFSVIIFLFITSIICFEINQMKNKNRSYLVFNLYLVIAVLSFFLFLFLLITEIVSLLFIITTIATIWLFDTFSYIGGKIIGGAKLMPKISSGKTLSGLITGVFVTVLLIQLLFYYLEIKYKFSIYYTLFIIVLSFVGDTVVSMLKRYASIKDSGKIMPGHGGLLDRFDSFIIVFLIFGISSL
tara:strand:- start:628 stop:1269 length:642 start_codon:yes stop_codon:yes gene_type:complete